MPVPCECAWCAARLPGGTTSAPVAGSSTRTAPSADPRASKCLALAVTSSRPAVPVPSAPFDPGPDSGPDPGPDPPPTEAAAEAGEEEEEELAALASGPRTTLPMHWQVTGTASGSGPSDSDSESKEDTRRSVPSVGLSIRSRTTLMTHLPAGWSGRAVTRQSSSQADIWILAPDGTKLRSVVDVDNWHAQRKKVLSRAERKLFEDSCRLVRRKAAERMKALITSNKGLEEEIKAREERLRRETAAHENQIELLMAKADEKMKQEIRAAEEKRKSDLERFQKDMYAKLQVAEDKMNSEVQAREQRMKEEEERHRKDMERMRLELNKKMEEQKKKYLEEIHALEQQCINLKACTIM